MFGLDSFGALPESMKGALLAAGLALLGTLITASAALLGVVMSNWAAGRRQRLDIKNAREDERVSREHELRQKVYLEAVEAMNAQMLIVARMPDLNRSQKEISDASLATGAGIEKAILIGGSGVVNCLFNIGANYGTLMKDLTVLRLDAQAEMSKAGGSLERVRELGQKISLISLEGIATYRRLTIAFVREVRLELGLSFDEATYSAIIESNATKMRQRLIEPLRAQMVDKVPR